MSCLPNCFHKTLTRKTLTRWSLRILPVLVVALALWSAPAQAQDTGAGDASTQAASTQAAPTQAATVISQDITQNTTWTKAGSPYQVTRNVAVRPGVMLTVEPGVEVVFNEFAPLSVQGALVAVGTPAQPILFTGATKQVGYWGGIIVGNTPEQPASLTFDYVTVEYAVLAGLFNRGNVELRSAVADINHSTFRFGGSHGLYASNGSLALRNSTFTNNSDSAVLLTGGDGSDPVLANLTASANADFNAVVYYNYRLTKPQTLEQMGLPYVFKAGFDVQENGALTLTAGIEVRTDTGFYVDGGDLTALGTVAEPVLLTGIKQEPGGWWGLGITSGPTGRIANVRLDRTIVEYGGSNTAGYGGNIVVSSANLLVTNSILRNSNRYGVYNDGGAPEELFAVKLDNVTITGNQEGAVVCTDESCNMTMTNLQVSGNGSNTYIVRGGVLVDTVWNALGIPYQVEGQGGVFGGAKLTIEPGVEVRMGPGASFAVDGSLVAVGEASKPIAFTAANGQPGSWQGINVSPTGFAELRYCDVGLGGNWGFNGDGVGMIITRSNSTFINFCRVHDSATAGIAVAANAQPVIDHNSITGNAVGLDAALAMRQVDARLNWWGAASGPVHPNNPGGSGQPIKGDVLFDPWLRSPDDPGNGGQAGLTVELAGPGRFAPGETAIYSIFYRNNLGQAIDNAVLRFGMPANAELVEIGRGGTFFYDRDQVFWKLGTLANGGQGIVYVRVRYDWGLPDGQKSTTAAQLSGTNVPAAVFDVAPYLAYVPRTVTGVADLSEVQVQALRGTSPSFNELYGQVTAAGFKFGAAEQNTYSTGQSEVAVTLLRFQPQFAVFTLWLANGKGVGGLTEGSSYTVFRSGSALRYDLQTNAWSPVAIGVSPGVSPGGIVQASEFTWSDCMQNCIEEKLPGYIIKKKIKSLSEVSKISACVQSAQGDEGSMLGCAKYIGKLIPGVGEGIDLGQCNLDCQTCEELGGDCSNPLCHCCSEDSYRCDAHDWLYGSFGIDVIKLRKCNIDDPDEGIGKYLAETVVKVCALCEKCLNNGAQMVCVSKNAFQFEALNTLATVATLAAQHGARAELEATVSADLECEECRQAKDPNELYGPAGDLLPGQLVTYTIAYENVGEGVAFGVFIANQLSDVFDVSTLQIGNGGSYSAGAQSLFWNVGDLAPQGQDGAKGTVSYSVRLRSNLPSGTVVDNQAVVHFPSVPEETPTNRVVNVVQPLVAEPQQLETPAGQPLALTLRGRDAINAPLTYAIVEGPLYGTLTGAAPNLQYVPQTGAGKLDRIRFTVNNGTSTSTPADVAIRILPAPTDNSGPGVVWTTPGANSEVRLAALVAGTDNTGTYYYPAVLAQFSEPVDAASVNPKTVLVTDANGTTIPADVRYDGAADQMQLLMKQQPVEGMAYAVTLTTGIHDLRGNPLAAHSWRFTVRNVDGTAGQAEQKLFLPVVRR